MAAQTSYGYSTPKGVPGGMYDISFSEVVTRNNEEEDGALKYGMAVMVGTTPGTTVKKPVAGTTADQIEGIAIAAPNTEQDMKGNVVVRNGVSLNVMKKGGVWGRLATDVTPSYGVPAYVVIDGDDAGKFTTASEGTVDIGAKFGRDTDDGIAVIVLK